MSKNPIIAFCLSLFIFPGAGHIYMGRKKLGGLILFVFLVIAGFLLIRFELDVVRQVKQMTEPLAALSIKNTLIQNSWSRDQDIYTYGLAALGIIWLGAALDSLRRPTPPPV